VTGNKELLLKSLRNEATPRPAWLPFVGVHGAKMIGVTADKYLQSADLIVQGLRKAHERYRPDGLPIVFDLQLEAEVLGCQLKWAKEAPPAVVSHPLEKGKLADLPTFDLSQGRYPIVKQALQTLKKEIGDQTALYGLITGPFTMALHLLGNNIFLAMFDEPEKVKQVVALATSIARHASDFYIENGADVIAVVDPMTSQISQDHFHEFVTPYANAIFDHVRAHGALSSLFVCGDASRNLEAMCRTTCDNISIDENIPLDRLRDLTRHSDKSFGGNLKLTSVLLLGDDDDARLDAIRCMDVGGACGFVLAPGCDLPYGTPEVNMEAVSEMVHDTYKREVARRTIITKAAESSGDLKLPDYKKEKVVCVDVITLDSSSCAPCQYMMDATQRAAKTSEVPVKIIEHRITTREGIAMMKRLGVANIPTICLDGKAEFVSLIPDQNTLVEALRECARKKGCV
jgi:MtaA/CmuA family methyltransferase